MKSCSFCIPCKAKRFYSVTCLSTKDEELRRKTMAAVLKSISRAVEKTECPSFAGTVQSELIAKLTGNKDPFRKQKLDAIRRAKKIYPEFEKWVLSGKSDYGRFERALKLAIAGNALELSAPNYSVEMGRLRDEMRSLLGMKLSIDDTRKIYGRVTKASNVLYLCDNCGEAVFDVPLIREIIRHAALTIAVCSEPMDEDISFNEAKLVGLGKMAPVIGKGRSYGVWKKKAPKEFWKKLGNASLIIAKGMANYETLDEYKEVAKGRTAFLLLVKCPAVGASLRQKEGSLVAKTV